METRTGASKSKNRANSSSFQNSKNPKKNHPKVWNFGNSRNLLDFWILRLPFEFPKILNLGWNFWVFGILETRAEASKSKNRANSSSFQNSKNPKKSPQGLEFWKLEEFARFLDFEAPVRVSKNPKLGLEFLDFWNFGNSSGSLQIQKSSKFLEFPKFQKSKKITPRFGILETRGICSIFGY